MGDNYISNGFGCLSCVKVMKGARNCGIVLDFVLPQRIDGANSPHESISLSWISAYECDISTSNPIASQRWGPRSPTLLDRDL